MKWLWLAVALVCATAAIAETIPPRIDRTGFALEQPEPQAARGGAYDRTSLTIYSPRLVFWIDAFGLKRGDRVLLTLKGPDHGIMAERILKMDPWPGSVFAFTGANRPPMGWKRGPYTGKVEILRGDLILDARTIQIALP
jgi:hypothetical protein